MSDRAHRGRHEPKAPPSAEPTPPAGLEAKRFGAIGEDWILLSFPARADGQALTSLTIEERNVIVGVMEGLSNNAIAKRLGKRPPTVRNQVQSAFRKLGVHSRIELIRLLVHGVRPR